jgi:hypothetical protein
VTSLALLQRRKHVGALLEHRPLEAAVAEAAPTSLFPFRGKRLEQRRSRGVTDAAPNLANMSEHRRSNRLARGSLPWPEPAPAQARPVCRGSITVEAPIAPGARLRITAWPRFAPDGSRWLSIEIEPYPSGGRKKPTAHNPLSDHG